LNYAVIVLLCEYLDQLNIEYMQGIDSVIKTFELN